MVQRRVGCRDIGAPECKVPELFGAGAWVCEAGVETAGCEVCDPVGSPFGCGGLVLDDAVGEEVIWGEGEVEGVADEGVVLSAVGALDIGV